MHLNVCKSGIWTDIITILDTQNVLELLLASSIIAAVVAVVAVIVRPADKMRS